MAKKSSMSPEPVAPARSMEQTESERKWRAEDALRDLERAEKHKSDPKLMKDVDACRNEKIRSLTRIKVEVAPKTMKKAK